MISICILFVLIWNAKSSSPDREDHCQHNKMEGKLLCGDSGIVSAHILFCRLSAQKRFYRNINVASSLNVARFKWFLQPDKVWWNAESCNNVIYTTFTGFLTDGLKQPSAKSVGCQKWSQYPTSTWWFKCIGIVRRGGQWGIPWSPQCCSLRSSDSVFPFYFCVQNLIVIYIIFDMNFYM